jgi:hypothetical protein
MAMSGDSFEFEKELDLDVEVEISFDPSLNYESELEIDYDICVDADVDGNIATLTFDAEAVGEDTLVEANVFVLAIDDELSAVGGSITAVAD